MLDWFVVLTPVLVLPIAALLVFLGCSLEHPSRPALSEVWMALLVSREVETFRLHSVSFQWAVGGTVFGPVALDPDAISREGSPWRATWRPRSGALQVAERDWAWSINSFISTLQLGSLAASPGDWSVSCTVNFVQPGQTMPEVDRVDTAGRVISGSGRDFHFRLVPEMQADGTTRVDLRLATGGRL